MSAQNVMTCLLITVVVIQNVENAKSLSITDRLLDEKINKPNLKKYNRLQYSYFFSLFLNIPK